MASIDQESGHNYSRSKGILEKFIWKVGEGGREIKKVGEEDPRRIVHSLKVGLAIAVVSLVYYFEPLYNGFGVSAMWAVITVVVVFEFSVGATLGRGVNRAVATLLGGALGVGAHRLASSSGDKFEPLLLGLSVFLLATVVTFARFVSKIKARYDYGLLIFILTFSLICVSGYRDDEVLDIAYTRLSTILIGGSAALVISVCICPVWAGTDLHNFVATNIEELGSSLQGFGVEYLKSSSDEGQNKDDSMGSLTGHKSVLNSKSMEETLANWARWEPRHGGFRYRHPWQQYLKIGNLTRQCACRVEVLITYLNSRFQTPVALQPEFHESIATMSSESGNALQELAASIKTMNRFLTVNSIIVKANEADKNLKLLLKQQIQWIQDTDEELVEIIQAATVVSLLTDVVACIEKIVESVDELGSMARFKSSDSTAKTIKQRQLSLQGNGVNLSMVETHHVVSVE